MKFLAALDRYWFGRGSPTTLGLFRLLVGALSFVNCMLLLADWDAWFSERGYTPAWLSTLWSGPNPRVGSVSVPRINLIGGVTDDRIAFAFFVALTVASLLSALGLWTRFSTWAMAIGIISLHHRNGPILHGGDTVLRICAIYVAVAPSGAACSLDRLLALWRGEAAASPPPVSLWPQRLVTFNVALIYFTTVWVKYFGSLWRDGTATWYPARLPEFYRFPVPSFMNELPMVRVTTYGTLLVELAMATLVFYRPLRTPVIVGGILLHGYIEYSMNIPLFGYLMIAMYLCFYEGDEVARFARRLGDALGSWRVTLAVPAGMRLRPSAARFLDAVDPLDLVRFEESEEPAWSARRASGRPISTTRALISRAPGLWPFLLAPPFLARLLPRAIEPAPLPAPTEAAATAR